MANQWGSNSLAPGEMAWYYMLYPYEGGFLPILQVIPTSPSLTEPDICDWTEIIPGDHGFLQNSPSNSYLFMNQLGYSTNWVKMSDDQSWLIHYVLVQNNSQNPIDFAFLESDQ